uniref:ATP synthase CF1, subunit epsilon n=1 Tax=Ascoseira mirabilis TaxID=76830 RepID=UPI003001AACC|nr:ATP synthase CF1, subunit epsilon [Ascoseira mirabilis]
MVLNIRVIGPNGLVCDIDTNEVVLPSLTGRVGVLDDHAPLITSLRVGLIRIKTEVSWVPIIVTGGFAIIENNKIVAIVSGLENLKDETYSEVEELVTKATETLNLAKTTKEKIDASLRLKIEEAKLDSFKYL